MSQKKKEKRKDQNNILITGNEAIGEAAVMAGCEFYAGYPITPQNELTAYMAKRMKELNRVFIQAESEVAAINMVFGAAATGVRTMTSSSSPGISLKQEGISYIAGAQLPCVIVNVMRGGPGLGNIAPSQSDYFQATKGGGHGDYRLIVLAPSSVQESFDLVMLAFDLADTYRNPVMILTDAFLGQIAEPMKIDNSKLKIKNYKKDWALTGARGREPNIVRSFFLKEGVLEKHNKKLQASYSVIEKKEKRAQVICDADDSEILFVAYGISFRIAKEAAAILKKEKINADIFRPITLWPYPDEALKKAAKGKRGVFVFELSSGQMIEDVRLTLGNSIPTHFYGRMGGGVFSAAELADFVKSKSRGKSKK